MNSELTKRKVTDHRKGYTHIGTFKSRAIVYEMETDRLDSSGLHCLVALPFDGPLQEAIFLERPNRFVIRCALVGRDRIPTPDGIGDGNGFDVTDSTSPAVVEAHLPDPGRLKELLTPGKQVWLRRVREGKRKTAWSAVLCWSASGRSLVSLEAALPNRLVAEALRRQALPELAGWSLVRPEFAFGGSRWDFLLQRFDGRRLLLEVKSVTLAQEGCGLFPDAPTERGRRHVRELTRFAQSGEGEAALFFVAQRSDVKRIRAAASIDPIFAAALTEAHAAGVHLFARRCQLSFTRIVLDRSIPVET